MKPKLTKKLCNCDHEMYEIWNEYKSESVYFSGKPSKEELAEVIKKEWRPLFIKDYINKWIRVEPLKRIYCANYYEIINRN